MDLMESADSLPSCNNHYCFLSSAYKISPYPPFC